MKKIVLVLLATLCINSYAAKMHTITDMVGRQLSLPVKIERIVSIGSVPVVNALLMVLNSSKDVINGLPSWAERGFGKYQYLIEPRLKTNPVVQYGQNLDVEKIIQLKPDVVFVLTFSRALADVLAKKNIKVVVLKWDDAADVGPTMRLLGKILGKEKEANIYVDYFNNSVSKINKIVANIPKKDRIRVLYTRFYNMTQPVRIAEWWIKTAGGISVSAGKRATNSLSYDSEQLLAWNPQLIITSTPRGLKMLREDKKYKNIKAIKDGKTYSAPRSVMIWGQPTVEQPLMLYWALNKFYPKLMSKEELINEMKHFYKNFIEFP